MATLHLLGLGHAAGGHFNPGPDGRCVHPIGTFERDLEPVVLVAKDVLEELPVSKGSLVNITKFPL